MTDAYVGVLFKRYSVYGKQSPAYKTAQDVLGLIDKLVNDRTGSLALVEALKCFEIDPAKYQKVKS